MPNLFHGASLLPLVFQMRLLEVIHEILFDLCSGIPSRVHSDI